MADKVIDSESITLIDRWPGYPTRYGSPQGGFTDSGHHNVETAIFKAGEKCCVWNESTAGIKGMSTFIYLQVGTQNADVAIAAKMICIPGSATIWYQVGNNPDADVVFAAGPALVAVALSALTDAYWGWFWCGGVCPESHVSGLGGDYPTDDSVIPGVIGVGNMTADYLGFTIVEADTEAIIGYSTATDAAAA